MPLTASERVIELLRTLHDARVDWDGRSDGEGALLMPHAWRKHYMELERCLTELRQAERPLWWHVCQRYRFGVTRLLELPVTRRQRKLHLPPRTELVAGGIVSGQRLVVVRVYQWSERVDEGAVRAGVETLTSMMYNGRPERIELPLELYRRVVAEKLIAA